MLPWCLPRPVATCGLQGRCSLQMTVRATHYWLPLERDTDGVPRRHCTPPSLSIRGDETPRQCPLLTSLTCTISMMPNNADRPIYGVIDGKTPITTTSSRRQHYLPARHRVRHAFILVRGMESTIPPAFDTVLMLRVRVSENTDGTVLIYQRMIGDGAHPSSVPLHFLTKSLCLPLSFPFSVSRLLSSIGVASFLSQLC